MNNSALILGFETVFNVPPQEHLENVVSDVILKQLELHGIDFSAEGMKSILLSIYRMRDEAASENRTETTLREMVEAVLGYLEIEDPGLTNALTHTGSTALLPRITVTQGIMEVLNHCSEQSVPVGIVCNAPLGLEPEYIRLLYEREDILRFMADMQFSSENGRVRPHPLQYRYLISNLSLSPEETAVFSGIEGDIEALKRLNFRQIFVPPELQGKGEDVFIISDTREIISFL